jgi:hypothetical protein
MMVTVAVGVDTGWKKVGGQKGVNREEIQYREDSYK